MFLTNESVITKSTEWKKKAKVTKKKIFFLPFGRGRDTNPTYNEVQWLQQWGTVITALVKFMQFEILIQLLLNPLFLFFPFLLPLAKAHNIYMWYRDLSTNEFHALWDSKIASYFSSPSENKPKNRNPHQLLLLNLMVLLSLKVFV